MGKHSPDVEQELATLTRGCEQVYTAEELRERIRSARQAGRPLRVKLGMDPTAPDIHLGHVVQLRKLRQFQDFGHKAVLIIGDYTAMVGDPSGQTRTRPILSREQVEANAQTYLDQAGKILDLSEDKLEVRRNSEWLASMNFADALKLASRMTVARMMERDTFEKRWKENRPIYIHEFLYPLMQGRDSVMIRSDVELGGTDQTFNNLVGRELQRDAGQEPQIVMILPILPGLDGVEKMSKSLGNYIGVTESSSEMFAKVMSLPDSAMRCYFELLTERTGEQIRELLDPARTHPRDAKVALAKDIVTQFHGRSEADAAEEEFFRIHGAGRDGLPDQIPELAVPPELFDDGRIPPAKLVVHCGFATSNSEARRLIREKGIRLNGQVVADANTPLVVRTGDVIQRGKRKFVRLRCPA